MLQRRTGWFVQKTQCFLAQVHTEPTTWSYIAVGCGLSGFVLEKGRQTGGLVTKGGCGQSLHSVQMRGNDGEIWSLMSGGTFLFLLSFFLPTAAL